MALKINGTTVIDDNKNAIVQQITFPDGSVQSSTGNKALSGVLYVDKGGNDTSGTGAITKPFLTIQAAINYAQTTFSSGQSIEILISPGAYTENITLTRARTYLRGSTRGTTKSTQITGTISISLSAGLGGVYNDIFSLEDLLVTSSTASSSVITLAGTQPYSFYGNNIVVIGTGASANCIAITNTSSGGLRFEVNNSIIQNYSSNQPLSLMSNSFSALYNDVTFNSYAASSLKVTTSNVSLYNSKCYATTATPVVDVISGFGTQFNPVTAPTGSIALTVGTTLIYNTATNGSGINLAAGSSAVIGTSTVFSVPVGTGYAINGSSGAFLFGNGWSFMPSYNTSINPVFSLNTTYYPLTESTKVISGSLVNYGTVVFDNKLTNAGVPSTSKGASGDLKGQVAFDSTYIYYCTANYTGNNANIWKRVSWSSNTW